MRKHLPMLCHFGRLLLMICVGAGLSGYGQLVLDKAAELDRIDVDEHLGASVPRQLEFVNESGRTIKLADFFQSGRPVVLTLAYYECPMLCTFVLNALSDAVSKLDWSPGREYQMVTVSIDPTEPPELASAKRSRYIGKLDRGNIAPGWRFLVGDQPSIDRLADAVGFRYFYNEKTDQYAHPAVVFILTDDGRISRYLYGLEYDAKDLRLALLEAADGKIGTIVDRVILFCHQYDPTGKRYAVAAMRVMQLGGLATMTILGGFVFMLWVRESKKEDHQRTG